MSTYFVLLNVKTLSKYTRHILDKFRTTAMFTYVNHIFLIVIANIYLENLFLIHILSVLHSIFPKYKLYKTSHLHRYICGLLDFFFFLYRP